MDGRRRPPVLGQLIVLLQARHAAAPLLVLGADEARPVLLGSLRGVRTCSVTVAARVAGPLARCWRFRARVVGHRRLPPGSARRLRVRVPDVAVEAPHAVLAAAPDDDVLDRDRRRAARPAASGWRCRPRRPGRRNSATSSGRSVMSPTPASMAPRQNRSIASRPSARAAPGGSTAPSGVYMAATAAASPRLNACSNFWSAARTASSAVSASAVRSRGRPIRRVPDPCLA